MQWIFGEFVDSNSFTMILNKSLSLFRCCEDMGRYYQTLPTLNGVDYVWGTNSGLRTMPLVGLLAGMQTVFSGYWQWFYLGLAVGLPLVTMFAVLRVARFSGFQAGVGAIFFAFNVWVWHRLQSGFWQLNLAYAVTPLILALPFWNANPKKSIKAALVWGMLVSVVFYFQPHFLATTFLMVAVILATRAHNRLQTIRFLAGGCLAALLMTSFVWLPAIWSETKSGWPLNSYSVRAVGENGANATVVNVITLWPFDKQAGGWPEWAARSVPFLVAALTLAGRKKFTLLGLLLVFVFAAKGLNWPFTNLSGWIYENLPLMQGFRDPTRFVSAIVLIMTLGIALAMKTAGRWWVVPAAAVLITAGLQVNEFAKTYAPLLPKMVKIPDEYHQMQEFINKSDSFGWRILVVPNYQGIDRLNWFTEKPSRSYHQSMFLVNLPLKSDLISSTGYANNPGAEVLALAYKDTNSPTKLNAWMINLQATHILEDGCVRDYQSAIEASPYFNKVFESGCLRLYRTKTERINDGRREYLNGDYELLRQQVLTDPLKQYVLLNQKENLRWLDPEAINSPDKDHLGLLSLALEKAASDYSALPINEPKKFGARVVSYEDYKLRSVLETGAVFSSENALLFDDDSRIAINSLRPGEYQVAAKYLTNGESVAATLKNRTSSMTFKLESKKLAWQALGTWKVEADGGQTELSIEKGSGLVIDWLLMIPEPKWQSFLKQEYAQGKWPERGKFSPISYGSGWQDAQAMPMVNGYALGGENKFYLPQVAFVIGLMVSIAAYAAGCLYCLNIGNGGRPIQNLRPEVG